MSKHTAAHLESVVLPPSDSSSRRDFSSTNVDARREIPRHDSLADVQTFTELYHLAHLSDIFQKASMILQGDLLIAEIPGITPAEIKALQDETTNKWKQPRMLYFTVLVCSMGAVEQGWAQTGMNGANLGIPKAFGIGSNSKHDSFVLGLLNCGIYLSVCVVRSWIELLLFRLILGAGLGINASTVSVYMAETAPAVIRGSISVSYQMWTAFGIFLGFCANAAVYNYGDSAWRLQLAGPVVPTIPLLLLVYMCPESPAWYIKNNNRYDLAFRSLRKLRNSDLQAAKEIFSTYLQRRSQAKPGAAGKSLFRRLPELFTIPRIRRATVASYVVMLSQQLCGST
ncbi:hypothetical protein HRR78_006355 [Exophiala dermatitidis]|nr:hypothetical protein HRR78_006355 [Exophiala dermatitidis]